ncbi:TlpA family protein disulfide reductase [Rhodanobacter sp. FDAARGOS 1247]|jgi:thiol-disulfide isomerase/thioredoxin|uniref:TlpA family protein disulfide reductase n=1 Tax=Rhodanobacter sp. FDAARGOS 1247 TaxID=2778082 RepID=UPI00194F243B|nr:TlpA disulfide reductase family protein [Rhodanobacter sp. FDAARGOS 1247]QRP64753.1 TlpA family protein disulfide reductase [Rhodanobacter sp. FDAARGOS 1247]
MTLLHSTSFRSVVFGLALAFGLAAQAAMPERPSLHVTTLDGKTFDLSAQRGKWVIVNYWATWCVPCIKEMPDISRFVASHKNVAAIGLAYDDSEPADIKAFIAKHPVVYPIAQVTLDKPLKDFDEPRGLPTTYLISPDGKVAKHIVGPVTEASLAALIGQP